MTPRQAPIVVGTACEPSAAVSVKTTTPDERKVPDRGARGHLKVAKMLASRSVSCPESFKERVKAAPASVD